MGRWAPVVGGMLLNVALGSLFAWSVFVLPLEQEFGWTRAQTSWVFTIAMMATTVCLVIGGRLQDRFGPRLGASIGAVAIAGAYWSASFTRSLAFVYVTFGVIGGIANGIGYAATVPTASKWFPDRRGLAVGLIVGAYGGGSAVIGPLAAALVEQVGWRMTFRLLGAAFFVAASIGAVLLRNPPESADERERAAATTTGLPHTLSGVLRTRTFWALWTAYWLGTTAGMMTISQLVPFARSAGMSLAAATLAIAVGACGNVGGRILSGWMSDSLGRMRTLRTMMIASAVAMPSLFLMREEPAVFFLLVAVVYWCYGTQLAVFGATAADFYGTGSLGLIYGALLTAVGLAGVLGPIIGAQAFDRFGHYGWAFVAASVLAIAALAALRLVQPPPLALTKEPSHI
jgi:OFA family oxalate/formate antiporter-like MFS transporter